MTPVLLHLLRHGAPELPNRMMGRTDDAPSADGISACVDRIANIEFAAIVTSDLRRARHTAEAISSGSSLPLIVDPRWRELDFGAWDGLAATEIDETALTEFHADPDANPPPGGERWSSLVARIAAALRVLPQGPVLIVTHGGAIRAALSVLCGFTPAQIWAFDLPYASLTTLRLWPGETPSAQIIELRP